MQYISIYIPVYYKEFSNCSESFSLNEADITWIQLGKRYEQERNSA